MRPSALVVGNYRSFPERTRMRIAPLTMLYGWNNAGKSALLRMVALLGSSVRESATAPLMLSSLEVDEAQHMDFRSVFWGGDPSLVAEEGLVLGLEWADGSRPIRAEYVIDYSREQYRYYVRAIRLLGAGAEQPVAFEVNRGEASLSSFQSIAGGPEASLEMRFVGLVPPDDVPMLSDLRTRMVALRDRVLWLRGVRARPKPLIVPTGETVRVLASDGADAAQVLLTDKAVRERVAGWYREACKRELVIEDVLSGVHRVLLPPSSAPGTIVNILSTGEGMSQCLPVLVAGALAERPNGPRLVAIEEPDSHLHPSAQKGLARFLCQVASSAGQPAILLETHSFTLMLGVQLAIARGDIPAEDVCAYWLNTTSAGATRLEEITFDKRGRPTSDASLGIFAEETQLAQELADEQLGE